MKFLDIKNGLIAAIFMVGSINAMAQTATVTFGGTITGGTCVITLSTSANSTASVSSLTITLPTITNSTTSTGLGGIARTRGATTFYMGVNSCGSTTYSTLKLTLASTGTTAGLIDTGVTDIKYQLLDSTGAILDVSTTTASSTYSWTGSQAAASEKAFTIRYYSQSAAPSTGSTTASMTVTLSYS